MAEPVGIALEADALPADLRAAWQAYLLALADDEFLLGHRDSEWTGLGPILEEDIAFSSMAQDELGHALVWYGLVHRLGADSPDRLAFLRPAPAWRNARLVEQPRGDYATSLVRQLLFDLAEAVRYGALSECPFAPVAEAARKLRQEEKYHLIHGRTYLSRLGQATAESRDRLQAALDALFPLALGLFEPPEGEATLVAAGLVPPSAALEAAWLAALVPLVRNSELALAGVVPAGAGWRATVPGDRGGRRGEHGPELDALLAALQAMYRSDPEAEW
jgi:ring-1,2-phenylacetyl-CoA epoxidase subunit PaaC